MSVCKHPGLGLKRDFVPGQSSEKQHWYINEEHNMSLTDNESPQFVVQHKDPSRCVWKLQVENTTKFCQNDATNPFRGSQAVLWTGL